MSLLTSTVIVLGVAVECKSNLKYQACEVIFHVPRYLSIYVLKPLFAAQLLVLILIYTINKDLFMVGAIFFISNQLLSWIYFLYPCQHKQCFFFFPVATQL